MKNRFIPVFVLAALSAAPSEALDPATAAQKAVDILKEGRSFFGGALHISGGVGNAAKLRNAELYTRYSALTGSDARFAAPSSFEPFRNASTPPGPVRVVQPAVTADVEFRLPLKSFAKKLLHLGKD